MEIPPIAHLGFELLLLALLTATRPDQLWRDVPVRRTRQVLLALLAVGLLLSVASHRRSPWGVLCGALSVRAAYFLCALDENLSLRARSPATVLAAAAAVADPFLWRSANGGIFTAAVCVWAPPLLLLVAMRLLDGSGTLPSASAPHDARAPLPVLGHLHKLVVAVVESRVRGGALVGARTRYKQR